MRKRTPAAIKAGMIAAAVLAIGSFGKWATPGEYAPVAILSKSGLESGGVLTLAAAIVVTLMLLRHRVLPIRGRATGILLIALAALALGIYKAVDIETKIDCEPVSCPDVIDIGWGLWLVIYASAVLAGAAFSLRRSAPRAAVAAARRRAARQRAPRRRLAAPQRAGLLESSPTSRAETVNLRSHPTGEETRPS